MRDKANFSIMPLILESISFIESSLLKSNGNAKVLVHCSKVRIFTFKLHREFPAHLQLLLDI